MQFAPVSAVIIEHARRSSREVQRRLTLQLNLSFRTNPEKTRIVGLTGDVRILTSWAVLTQSWITTDGQWTERQFPVILWKPLLVYEGAVLSHWRPLSLLWGHDERANTTSCCCRPEVQIGSCYNSTQIPSAGACVWPTGSPIATASDSHR